MNKRTAFTLIELLVVIAIIGILSGLIVVSMSGVTSKATIAKAQVFSNSLRNSLMASLTSQYSFDDITDYNSTTKIMNSTAGNVPDSWGGVECQAFGGPTFTTSGCISGSCLSFDGTDDYVDCGTGSSLNFLASGAYTWSFWVKFAQIYTSPTGDRNRIFQKVTTGKGYILAVKDTGYFEISNPNGWSGLTTTSALTAGTWYNLVLTYNNQNVVIYVNGVLNNSGTAGTFIDNAESIPRIGGATNTVCPNGLIDEVRIYNASIPTSQIKEQYYAGLTKLFNSGSLSEEEYASRIEKVAYEN